MTERRTFLKTASASPAASLTNRARPGAKRLAILASRWTPGSPARQVADRFLIGYPREGRWHRPAMDVISLYVDRTPDADQSRERAAEFGFRIYSSVAETLRCGRDRLAVDGVLMLTGQGDDSRSALTGSDLLEPLVKVFEEDRRAVPVYWDEPLGLAQARRMAEASRQLKFPVLAGSFLPMTWRLPPLELPTGSRVEQALLVGIGFGRSDRYRALETLQAMVERRGGGETGVRSVQWVGGQAVWRAGNSGRWSRDLLKAAVARSDSLQGKTLKDGRPRDLVDTGELPRLVEHPNRKQGDKSLIKPSRRDRKRWFLGVYIPPWRKTSRSLMWKLTYRVRVYRKIGWQPNEPLCMFAFQPSTTPPPPKRELWGRLNLSNAPDSQLS